MTESELQEKTGRFVANQVLYNLSHWVDFAINEASHSRVSDRCPIDVEDIPYVQTCEECKGTGFELCSEGECDNPDCECSLEGDDWSVTDKICNECNDGETKIEIFEWWAVSRGLAQALADKGEVVLAGEVWGRQTTGQAISIDWVIEDIVTDINEKFS